MKNSTRDEIAFYVQKKQLLGKDGFAATGLGMLDGAFTIRLKPMRSKFWNFRDRECCIQITYKPKPNK